MGGVLVPRLGMRAVANNPSTRAVEGVRYVECGGGGWVEGDGVWMGSVHGVHGQECRYLSDVW